MADKSSKRLPPKLPSGKRMTPNKVYNSTRKEKKKMVYAIKDGEGKLIHFGQVGYKHNYSDKAKKNYLARSGGIRNKAGQKTSTDRHSANYWARKVLWPKDN